jgi:hypothetical protein
MTIRTLVAAAVLAIGIAGVASARDTVVTAQFEAPTAQARLIADSAVWNCANATCRAIPIHEVSVRACRALARESHVRITAYGSETRQLSADELSRCNGDAPAVQQARN